ncbi:MAG: LptF/LptG family permease [Pseudobdellovibrionaceae bacterium]
MSVRSKNPPVLLWRYVALRYLFNLIFVALILLGLILFFDMIELLRRAAKFENVSFWMVLQMGVLKLPDVGQVLAPFIILFSALFTFWQLNRKQEVTIFRVAGFSIWQFAGPVLAVAFAIGIFFTTVINPVGAVLIQKYMLMESLYLSRDEPQITLLENGLWLRQSTPGGYIVMHAREIDMSDWNVGEVMALAFSQDDVFKWRLDAPEGALKKGNWTFPLATITPSQGVVQTNKTASLPTKLTARKIEDSFADPRTMPFWRLPSHIRTLEATGFDPASLRIHYQGLLADPFLFAALVLVAACVTLRPPRAQNTFSLITLGVAVGFVVFFLSNFLQALGASHQISIGVAAWAPILITSLFGIGVILSLEDG